MVEKNTTDSKIIVGKMGMAPVYQLPTGIHPWTEYSHRANRYRSNGYGYHMKRIVRKIEHFDTLPLGQFQEIIKKNTDDLHGVEVIMQPTSSLTPERKERGGQLLVIGWTWDITREERDFFDALDAASH